MINALVSRPVMEKLSQGPANHFTRSHGFCEVFSTITGRGLPCKGGGRVKVLPGDAAQIIEDLAAHLTVRDLDLAETMETLKSAAGLGVQGPQIYDLLHVKSALMCGAAVIYTRDADFKAIQPGLQIERP
ncbi:hypothetical protein NXS98_14290 [Fontisphaera persica]|uniref:type II toxin-antitoxin system VapC family toxin n=1 Tax=Fontisphaera persica TaxID=2974023 RepID=UPI0024BF5D34|nr:hypothetical protein [Fontisphaera persica]WCJ58878.1 hypothetical protein NXS98_14290 [Fontisphaera persica]